jgi:hypothetical protein
MQSNNQRTSSGSSGSSGYYAPTGTRSQFWNQQPNCSANTINYYPSTYCPTSYPASTSPNSQQLTGHIVGHCPVGPCTSGPFKSLR